MVHLFHSFHVKFRLAGSLSCVSLSLQIYSLTRFGAKCHACLDLTLAINFSLYVSELLGQLSLRQ